MPTLKHNYCTIELESRGKKGERLGLPAPQFVGFTSEALGLGDLGAKGIYKETLVAVFDLQGFTPFANQSDSHLSMPEYLKAYLDWLFRSLANELKVGADKGTVGLWAPLPFFTKFLGDGVLFLWDISNVNSQHVRNIACVLHVVLEKYAKEFLPEIKRAVVSPPPGLRCGIALGRVVSVGNGEDYVGSCINIASRLQKLSKLSFAVGRRGLNLDKVPPTGTPFEDFLKLTRVDLRGIGEELVYVLKAEMEHLSAEDRALFQEP